MKTNKKVRFIIFLFLILSILFAYGVRFYEHSSIKPSGGSLEKPSRTHLLGTDDLGIDVFAQISLSYFNSLKTGILTGIIALTLGLFLGYLSGYMSGTFEEFVLFLIDLFLSVPRFPVMLLIATFIGQNSWNIIFILGIFSWAPIAKIVNGITRVEVEKDYIRIAKKFGANSLYIFKNHLGLYICPILLIEGIHVMGRAIVHEASMAFLGLSDPTTKSLGLMINRALNFNGIYFTDFWKWWLAPPILVLLIITYGFRILSREFENMEKREGR